MRLVLYFAGIMMAWGLWFTEVIWMKGWRGLAWLQGFTWSSIPICLIIALLSSYALLFRSGSRDRSAFTAMISVVSLVSFLIVKRSVMELFSGGFPTGPRVGVGLLLLCGWLILPAGLALLSRRSTTPLRPLGSLLVAGAIAAALPLSFVTIKVFPAVNGNTDAIHAFKMGYPVIWITALVPLAVYCGRSRPA